MARRRPHILQLWEREYPLHDYTPTCSTHDTSILYVQWRIQGGSFEFGRTPGPLFSKWSWSTYFSTVPCTVLVVSLENRIRWLQIFNWGIAAEEEAASSLLSSLNLLAWKASSMATKSQNWTEVQQTRNNAHRTQPHPPMHAAAVLVVCWCNMAGIIKMLVSELSLKMLELQSSLELKVQIVIACLLLIYFFEFHYQ